MSASSARTRWLASPRASQADYDGVLAQERRAHAEAAEASERVKALEAALQTLSWLTHVMASSLCLRIVSSSSEEECAARATALLMNDSHL
jgi:hypothetical protein